MIPSFLRGKSTSIISISKIKKMKDIVVVQVSHKFEKIPFKSMYCVAGLPLIILYVKNLLMKEKKYW